MDFFSNTKTKDLNNEFAGIGGKLWQQGLITNAENTLLQQLGLFYETSELDLAEEYVANLTQNSIPQQFIYEVWIDSTLIYPQSPSPEHTESKEETRILIPSRKIVFGFKDEQTGELFGPYQTEVLVWQRTS